MNKIQHINTFFNKFMIADKVGVPRAGLFINPLLTNPNRRSVLSAPGQAEPFCGRGAEHAWGDLLQETRLQNGTLFQNKLLLVSLMRLQKGKGFNKGLIEAK